VTGTAAAPLLRRLFPAFEIVAVENTFFGADVTVSGLLTGGDIVRALDGAGYDVAHLPPNAFREGTETMLDGVTLTEIRAKLGMDVKIGFENQNQPV
jgi:NifB/MoaA-like Fe-S oxidoreductase